MKDKEPVYCKSCIHYRQSTTHHEYISICFCNPKITHTFAGPNITYEHCVNKNRNCDCSDYSPDFFTRMWKYLNNLPIAGLKKVVNKTTRLEKK